MPYQNNIFSFKRLENTPIEIATKIKDPQFYIITFSNRKLIFLQPCICGGVGKLIGNSKESAVA